MAQKDDETSNQPVDMKLSSTKPIGAKWMIEVSDYIVSSGHDRNGFKNTGILHFLKS